MKAIIASAIVLFSMNTISAQYGGGGYPGGGMNGGGMGRGGMNGGMNHNSSMNNQPTTEKEKSKEEIVAIVMKKLKPELQLDELQEIAVSQILTESLKSQGVIIKKEIEQDEKIKQIDALSETTDRKIMELLNKDQKVKYKAYMEDRRTNIEKNKNR